MADSYFRLPSTGAISFEGGRTGLDKLGEEFQGLADFGQPEVGLY